MRVTRVDPLVGTLVEVELVALDQMERALRGLVEQDIGAAETKDVLKQLADGPLLSNARALSSKGERDA